jgi:3-hydroxybutyryl-CoA dehydrogenase
MAVVGSGAIACGLAATASMVGEVVLWARSQSSAEHARETVDDVCSKMGEDARAARVFVATDLDALVEATIVVEAIVEDLPTKGGLLKDIASRVDGFTLLATTTSSLSVEKLAEASGQPQRFVGLHIFKPVPRMKLIELVFPQAAARETRQRAHALCEALGKEAIEVPEIAGFVANRLLFPYLFSAVMLMEETGLEPKAIDTCMQLGAGQPKGPLALIDYVALDVSKAIGQSIGAPIPATIDQLISEGALGKKSGRGLYDYRVA